MVQTAGVYATTKSTIPRGKSNLLPICHIFRFYEFAKSFDTRSRSATARAQRRPSITGRLVRIGLIELAGIKAKAVGRPQLDISHVKAATRVIPSRGVVVAHVGNCGRQNNSAATAETAAAGTPPAVTPQARAVTRSRWPLSLLLNYLGSAAIGRPPVAS